MKKLWALILTLALVLSMVPVFSSCGAEEGSEKNDGEDKASETEEAKASDDAEKGKKPGAFENPFLGTAWTGKAIFDNGIVTGETPAEAVFTEDGARIELTVDEDAYIEILLQSALVMRYGKDYDLETEAAEIGTTVDALLQQYRQPFEKTNTTFLYSFQYDGTTVTCGGNSEGNSFADGKLIVSGSKQLTFELTKK